jgi:hypothetical protein
LLAFQPCTMLMMFFPKQIGKVMSATSWANVRLAINSRIPGQSFEANVPKGGRIVRPIGEWSHFMRYRAKKNSSFPAQKMNSVL